jgi:ATP-dependent Clp protease adaptor protein ClpS
MELKNITPEVEKELDAQIKESLSHKLMLFNDDYNTFEHVIRCLELYCGHGSMQAEQCALIVHNNGQCDVKRGPYEKLEPICTALQDAGLTADII